MGLMILQISLRTDGLKNGDKVWVNENISGNVNETIKF